jgi:hypothetical protein
VNPLKYNAIITAIYVSGYGKYLHWGKIIPEGLTEQERKNYPMKIKDELKPFFLREINRRLLPKIKRNDIDTPAHVQFEVPVGMVNHEGKKTIRPVHTKRRIVHLKSGKDMSKFFDSIDNEWNGIFINFRNKNPDN